MLQVGLGLVAHHKSIIEHLHEYIVQVPGGQLYWSGWQILTYINV